MVGGVFLDFRASRGWGMMGGVFPDFGVPRGRERWVEYFQISGLRGGDWWVEYIFKF